MIAFMSTGLGLGAVLTARATTRFALGLAFALESVAPCFSRVDFTAAGLGFGRGLGGASCAPVLTFSGT